MGNSTEGLKRRPLEEIERFANDSPTNNDVTLVKEGRLRMFDETTSKWSDATLKLYSNAELEWTLDQYLGKQTSEQLEFLKNGRMRIPPGRKARPYDQTGGVINSFTIDFFLPLQSSPIPPHSTYKTRRQLIFASKDTKESARWMHMINYVSLRRSTELMKHNHPLTPCGPILTVIHSTSPTTVQEEKIGPSRIDCCAEESFTCDYCNEVLFAQEAQHCEFCKYNICQPCAHAVNTQVERLVYSADHPHPLIHLRNFYDRSWSSTDYDSGYICRICKKQNKGSVYHCVECGNYDECPECFKQRAKDTHENHSMNQSIEDEQQFDIGLLSHIISKSGNVYEMIKKGDKISPRAASMISKRCWDITKIDEEAVPNAYFEVTVMQLEGQYVSVGVGNQIFVQNQLLGYQQNSFGFCNNGQVTQNVGTNIQHFPSFGAGDTIGVGMLLDSFNMRRLFFTKNGEYLGCFNERVHVGMDCFPGVSITTTTCQSVKFSMNTAGPFQFDTKSIPDYRQDRRNLFEQLPAELIVKCLSFTTPQQILKFTYHFGSVASENAIWKRLFLLKWPLQNSNLKLKSWMKLFKRRLETEKRMIRERRMHVVRKKYRRGHHWIENCDSESECPLIFEDLFLTEIETEGDVQCKSCNKTVYRVNDTVALDQYVAMGRCVSMLGLVNGGSMGQLGQADVLPQ